MSSYPVARRIECPFCKGKVRSDDTKCRWCQSSLRAQQPPQQQPRAPSQPNVAKPLYQTPSVSWSKLDQHYGDHVAWKTLLSTGQSIMIGEGEGAAQVQGGKLVRSLPYGTSQMTNPGEEASSRPLGVLFTKTSLQTMNWGQSEMATADGILVGASGTIGLRLSDPAKLLSIFPAGQSYFSQKDMKILLSRLLGSTLEGIISQLKWLNLLVGGKKRLAETITAQVRTQLGSFGLELTDLEVSSLMLPDELRRALKERGIKELETRAELEKLEEMKRAGYDVNRLMVAEKIAEKGADVHFVDSDNYVVGTNIKAEDSVLVRPDFSVGGIRSQPQEMTGQAVSCPKCDAQLEASSRVCGSCGSRFLMCPKDGTVVLVDSSPGAKPKFCHQCGGPLS